MAEMYHIQMIVFDWAGTTTDYGGVAPSVVFDRVFQEEGICLTKEEINAPMGMEKKAHIRALLSQKHEALGAREGLAAAVAATFQMRADHLVDRGVVLDDEYVGNGFHGKQDNTRGCVGVGIFKQS